MGFFNFSFKNKSKDFPYLKKGNPNNFPRERTVAIYCSSGMTGYECAYELGARIATSPNLGGVVTGGTVGLMEAVNKGCKEAGGYSIGITEKTFEHLQPPNEYLDELHSTSNDMEREDYYNKRAAYTIVLPGGPGTLKEGFNKISLLLKIKFFNKQTNGRFQQQVILLETPETQGFWSELYAWMCKFPRQTSFYDRYLAHIVVAKTVDEAIKELEKGLDYNPLDDKTRFDKEANTLVENGLITIK